MVDDCPLIFLNHLCDGEPVAGVSCSSWGFLNHLCDGEHYATAAQMGFIGTADDLEMAKQADAESEPATAQDEAAPADSVATETTETAQPENF